MPSSMPRPLPYFALSLALTACGDDARPDDTGAATGSTVSATIATEPGTSDSSSGSGGQTGTPTTTESGGGMSATMGGTSSTQGTDSGPTTGGTDTSDTQGTSASSTTGGVCEADKLCGADCCGADELCDNGQCVPDCGGPPPCGDAKLCCADGDLCYLGECVTPGAACDEQVCATKPDLNSCGDGFLCDPSLKLCLPSKADLGCQYVPPLNVFKPTPVWTWGKRKAIACAKDADCQTSEVCTNKVCAVTWKHWVPGADDMPNHYQSSSIPLVIDLDDNCVPDVVFNTYSGTDITANGVLRAVRGDTGEKLWTVTDAAYRTNSTSNPAVGDIDGDGKPEVVAVGAGKYLVAIKSDGTPLWKSDAFTGGSSSGSLAIANMDNEGPPEIIHGAAVFDNLGKKKWEGAAGIGINGQGPISCIADLNGDGRPELIGGRTAYTTNGVIIANSFTGKTLWTSAVGTDGFCGVADFNADGKPEVVLVSSGSVHVLNGQTGVTLATAAIPQAGSGGPPNIADFDGDGVRDIGVAGSLRYTVYRFDPGANKLSTLWTAITEDDSSQVTGSSVFDFDGDGRNEVVYNDESYIRIYPGVEPDCALNPPGAGCNKNMTDVEVLFRDRNSSRTRTEYPVIADVDGDFKANIVFSTNNDSQAAIVTDAGIEVFKDSLDNWVSTRPVWNQHTYHITNVGLVGEIADTEQNNWTTPMGAPYNSYRNNVQGASDFCAPDLLPYDLNFDAALCMNQLDVSVYVANQGCLGVGPGVNVSFYEEVLGLLGTVQTQGPLVAGAAELVKLSVPGKFVSVNVWAVVDDDGMGNGQLNECIEDNNSAPMATLCIPPG